MEDLQPRADPVCQFAGPDGDRRRDLAQIHHRQDRPRDARSEPVNQRFRLCAFWEVDSDAHENRATTLAFDEQHPHMFIVDAIGGR